MAPETCCTADSTNEKLQHREAATQVKQLFICCSENRGNFFVSTTASQTHKLCPFPRSFSSCDATPAWHFYHVSSISRKSRQTSQSWQIIVKLLRQVLSRSSRSQCSPIVSFWANSILIVFYNKNRESHTCQLDILQIFRRWWDDG